MARPFPPRLAAISGRAALALGGCGAGDTGSPAGVAQSGAQQR